MRRATALNEVIRMRFNDLRQRYESIQLSPRGPGKPESMAKPARPTQPGKTTPSDAPAESRTTDLPPGDQAC